MALTTNNQYPTTNYGYEPSQLDLMASGFEQASLPTALPQTASPETAALGRQKDFARSMRGEIGLSAGLGAAQLATQLAPLPGERASRLRGEEARVV